MRQQLTKCETLVTNDDDEIVIEHQGPHGLVTIDLFEVLESIGSLHYMKCHHKRSIDIAETTESIIADIQEAVAREDEQARQEDIAADRAEAPYETKVLSRAGYVTGWPMTAGEA